MRFAVAGDVHGHAAEFLRLLLRLEAHGVDAIYAVGDLIDRGPASAECVRIARTWSFTTRDGSERGLEVVLGNHDENVACYRFGRVLPSRGVVPIPRDLSVARSLSDADYEWLDSLPYWRSIRADGQRYAVVHGGVPPSARRPSLWGRRRASLLCRTGYLDEKTGQPLSPWQVSRRFWADEYDGRFGHVFFGHTSFGRVRTFPYATGADCSKHGRLAAVIVSTEGEPMQELYEEIKEARTMFTLQPKRTGDPQNDLFGPPPAGGSRPAAVR